MSHRCWHGGIGVDLTEGTVFASSPEILEKRSENINKLACHVRLACAGPWPMAFDEFCRKGINPDDIPLHERLAGSFGNFSREQVAIEK